MSKQITLDMPLNERFWRYANLVTSNNFIVDDENKAQLAKIIDIVENNKKGIVICGKTGSGKTFIFEVLFKIYRAPFNKERITLRHVDKVIAQYEKMGDDAFDLQSQINICYDELGREKNPAKYFGSDCDVMQKVIANRYELFKKKGFRTFFTSNYSSTDLQIRYGDHCHSRLSEMAEFINLGTSLEYSDRRKIATPFVDGLPEVLGYRSDHVPEPPDNEEFLKMSLTLAEKMKLK